MIAALVLFHRDRQLPRDEAARAFETTAPRYRDLPGLHFKAYLHDPDGADLGGFYLWESREAAERVYTAEWRRSAAERYGAEPEIRYFEVLLTVDNGLAGRGMGDGSRVMAGASEAGAPPAQSPVTPPASGYPPSPVPPPAAV